MELEIKEKKENQIIEDKIEKNKKQRNVELYKSYKVFSFDLLFYYAIIYLFLTIEKGISAAEVLQFDAFYIFFKFLTQIPSTLLIQKIGKRKSIIIANVVLTIHILIIMCAANFEQLLISQLLCALGFTIKATCETDLLYDAIPRGEKRGSTFAKIDGKANARHYYIEAISSIISGFLFVINPYLPLVLCFVILVFVSVLSTKFEELQKMETKNTIKTEMKNLKYSFRNILKSKRLKSLLICNSIMVAMIKILQNLRNTVLLQINVPEQYFGTIFALLGIIMGIAAKNQDRIHKKYRNKTLAFLMLPTAISFLILGILTQLKIDFKYIVTIALVIFAVQYIMRGPYYILIKRYFNNFTNSDTRVKIATVNNFTENLIVSILLFGASFVLEKVPVSETLIIVGIILTILTIAVLNYMKKTVGLKPEQYGKREILQNSLTNIKS